MSDYLSNISSYLAYAGDCYPSLGTGGTTNAVTISQNLDYGRIFSQLGIQQQQAQHAAAIQQKAKPVPAAVVRDDEFAWLRGRVAELCWKAA